MPYTARRDDVWSAKPPLWWADALSNHGQALQLLAASNQLRHDKTSNQLRHDKKRALGTQLGADEHGAQPAARLPLTSLVGGGRAEATAGASMLTRAARESFQKGVSIGLWQNAWQRWNTEPPPSMADERIVRRGWVARTEPHFPHVAAAVLEASWQTLRDEAWSWHQSLGSRRGSISDAEISDAEAAGASGADAEGSDRIGSDRIGSSL